MFGASPSMNILLLYNIALSIQQLSPGPVVEALLYVIRYIISYTPSNPNRCETRNVYGNRVLKIVGTR